MIDLFDLSQIDKWNNTIQQCGNFEFYHLGDYHKIAEENNEGKAKLIVYREDDVTIAMPFLEREFNGYKDLTSVYGYPGPLVSGSVKTATAHRYREKLREILLDNKYISVFSRLNVFKRKSQVNILEGIGKTEELGKTIIVKLTDSYDSLFMSYERGHRQRIKKLRRNCKVIDDVDFKNLDIFIDIYNENMQRVCAKNYYFFGEKYFKSLVSMQKVEVKLFFVVGRTGEYIAGGIFIASCGMVEYHLSGTRTLSLKEAPMNMLLDSAIQYFMKKGYSVFNLGGGLGSQEDGLYRFKSGFSRNYATYCVWKFIPDLKKYHEVATNAGIDVPDGEEYKGYFPVYRRPL